jgi:hypothetical protein
MLEFARNEPIDIEVLEGLFARCGWEDDGAGTKLEWALAGSEEWVVCTLDGELIGFGRSSRLGPIKRVLFDVMVDPRFDHPALRAQIVRLLSQNAGSLEEVSVFVSRSQQSGSARTVGEPAGLEQTARASQVNAREPDADDDGLAASSEGTTEEGTSNAYTGGRLAIPEAPPGTYLGRNWIIKEDR